MSALWSSAVAGDPAGIAVAAYTEPTKSNMIVRSI